MRSTHLTVIVGIIGWLGGVWLSLKGWGTIYMLVAVLSLALMFYGLVVATRR